MDHALHEHITDCDIATYGLRGAFPPKYRQLLSGNLNNGALMDRLLNLRAFVRVADTLNFSEAAASLRLARSSVSKLIQDLEVELGTRLIQRSTRQVTLTADGHAFRKRCLDLIRDVESMEQMFATDGLRPKGVLRVSVPSRIAHLIVAPALPDFFVKYPEIELDLASTDRPVDLVGEGFD